VLDDLAEPAGLRPWVASGLEPNPSGLEMTAHRCGARCGRLAPPPDFGIYVEMSRALNRSRNRQRSTRQLWRWSTNPILHYIPTPNRRPNVGDNYVAILAVNARANPGADSN
jgi:hypothetical protein